MARGALRKTPVAITENPTEGNKEFANQAARIKHPASRVKRSGRQVIRPGARVKRSRHRAKRPIDGETHRVGPRGGGPDQRLGNRAIRIQSA